MSSFFWADDPVVRRPIVRPKIDDVVPIKGTPVLLRSVGPFPMDPPKYVQKRPPPEDFPPIKGTPVLLRSIGPFPDDARRVPFVRPTSDDTRSAAVAMLSVGALGDTLLPRVQATSRPWQDAAPGGSFAKSSGWLGDEVRVRVVSARAAEDPQAFHPSYSPVAKFFGEDPPRPWIAPAPKYDDAAAPHPSANAFGWIGDDAIRYAPPRKFTDDPQAFHPTYLPLRGFVGAEDGVRAWATARRPDDASMAPSAVGRSFGWITTDDRSRQAWIGVRADDSPAPHPTYFPLRSGGFGEEPQPARVLRRTAAEDVTLGARTLSAVTFEDAKIARTWRPPANDDYLPFVAKSTAVLSKFNWFADDVRPFVYRYKPPDDYSVFTPRQSTSLRVFGWSEEQPPLWKYRYRPTSEEVFHPSYLALRPFVASDDARAWQAPIIRWHDAVPPTGTRAGTGWIGDEPLVRLVRRANLVDEFFVHPSYMALGSIGFFDELRSGRWLATRPAADLQLGKRAPASFAWADDRRAPAWKPGATADENAPTSKSVVSTGWISIDRTTLPRPFAVQRDDAPALSATRAALGWAPDEPKRTSRRNAAADDNLTQRAKAASVGFASDVAARAAATRPASADETPPPSTKPLGSGWYAGDVQVRRQPPRIIDDAWPFTQPLAKSSIGWADAYQIRARITWGYTDGGELFAKLAFRIRLAFVVATDASDFVIAASASDIVTAADASNFVAAASTPDIVIAADGSFVLVAKPGQ